MQEYIRKLPLGTCKIVYEENFLDEKEESDMIDEFSNPSMFDFRGGNYEDREIKRTQSWHHDEDHYFNPKWPHFRRWDAQKSSPSVMKLQEKVNNHKKMDVTVNSTLFNRYAPTDTIPPHRDPESIFGDNPTIAVVSFNSTRTIRFCRVKPNIPSLKIVG